MRRKIRVGILGCGAIGSQLARIIDRKFPSVYRLTCLTDLSQEKALRLARSLKIKVRVVSQEEMIKRCDLVIEAASYKAVQPLVKEVLKRHKSVLVMSVGGLLGSKKAVKILKKGRGKIFLPSGAIAGIDGLLAAGMGKIKMVSLTTKKPPRAFAGAPFLKSRHISLEKIKEEKLLFRGTANQAVKAFPQNINVAALLSLAGIGPQKTIVKIYASPFLKRNIHQVEVEGDFGRMVTITENVPSPGNPKTSYLATLAPAALLKKMADTLKIGT